MKDIHQNAIINPVPSKTWYWLRMNERSVALDTEQTACLPEVTSAGMTEAPFFEKEGAAGSDFESCLHAVSEGWPAYAADPAGNASLTARYHFPSGTTVSALSLSVPQGQKALMIMDYQAGGDGTALIKTNFIVEKDALLTLVQVHRCPDDFRVINDIGGSVDEDGRIDLINLVISGKENDLACRFDLIGKHAHAEIHTGYSASADHEIDINYYLPHFGRLTSCNIEVNGVLREQSKKIFRGTIDFRRGCAGAKGSERENVLLIDDSVRNQTLPVILCSEEDVEGTHGASIGKLDDSLLYYLQSRGLPLDQVYEMMARSRLSSVVSLIPEASFREELENYLEGGSES